MRFPKTSIWLGFVLLVSYAAAQEDPPPPAETAWVNLLQGEVRALLPGAAEAVAAVRGMSLPEGTAVEVAEGGFVQLVAARAQSVLPLRGGQSWLVGAEAQDAVERPARAIAAVIDALRALQVSWQDGPAGRGLEGGLRGGPDGRDPFLIAPHFVSQLDPVVFLWYASKPVAAWQLTVCVEESLQTVWSSPRLAGGSSVFRGGLDVHELEMAESYLVRLEGFDQAGTRVGADQVYLERLDPDYRRTRGLVEELAAVDAIYAGEELDALAQAVKSAARGEVFARWGLWSEGGVRFLEAALTFPDGAPGNLWRLAGMLVGLGVASEQALAMAEMLVSRAEAGR